MTLQSLETCPPPPREFRLDALDVATRTLLLVGSIWAVVGCSMTLVCWFLASPLFGDSTLDERGVAADAVPLSVEQTSSRVNGRYAQRIHYSFTDRDGHPHQVSTESLDEAVIERARRNGLLRIEYDPRDPSLTRIEGASASVFGPWFLLLPLGFVLLGGSALTVGTWRARRIREVYMHGLTVRATVTEVRPSRTRTMGKRMMRVEYAFETSKGRATGHAIAAEPPAVGSLLWVAHAADDASRNVAVARVAGGR